VLKIMSDISTSMFREITGIINGKEFSVFRDYGTQETIIESNGLDQLENNKILDYLY
jgi:hypothetical protein